MSDHGKQQNLDSLPDWPNCSEQKSLKFDECHQNECGKPISTREKEENDVIFYPLVHSKIHSKPSAIKDVSASSAIKNKDHVYQRRKHERTIALSSVPGGYDGVQAPIMPIEACERHFLDNGKAPVCKQHYPRNPDVLKMQIIDLRRSSRIVSKTKFINKSSVGELPVSYIRKSALDCHSKSYYSCSLQSRVEHVASMKADGDEIGECSSSDMTKKTMSKTQSEKELCDCNITSHSLDILSVNEDASCSQICKICSLVDHTQKMLICDLCDEAFHMTCCNPRVKKVPVDEWYCRPCMKKKPKPLVGAMTASKPSDIMSENPGYMKKKLSILSMLKDAEPYTSDVRIGRAFQADVPDWSGPICNCVLSRAPLSELQTDDWDCFCSVLWDPVHSDCAVPQELGTNEVLAKLKYVELEMFSILKEGSVERGPIQIVRDQLPICDISFRYFYDTFMKEND